ncbi:hypothetical protein [Pseudoxanthomonas putridarboris]|uniref:Lipoprotein n=1 Tax=Pseudoxanthomonas putridarboris TaxID=752605 RepID=A0ABU9IY06_9GAMM
MKQLPFPACLPMVLGAILLAGCGRMPGKEDAADAARTASAIAGQASPAREAPRMQFADEALGIAILPTPGFTLRHDFRRAYLAAGDWKAFAEPDSPGTPLAALVLDGSNAVTAAELRVGASDDTRAVATCLDVANSATPDETEEVRIDGQPFRRFRASDAAMSHYLSVDAYRAVRHGHCIAIDLLVAGTRPEVYDPPRTPPFDQDTAHARLLEALAAVRFTR